MILELTRKQQLWFMDFLQNYKVLMKNHILNGTRVEDSIKNKIDEILSMSVKKNNIIALGLDQAEFFVEALEENFCSCPGCSLSSVKARKAITNKIYELINDEGIIYE